MFSFFWGVGGVLYFTALMSLSLDVTALRYKTLQNVFHWFICKCIPVQLSLAREGRLQTLNIVAL